MINLILTLLVTHFIGLFIFKPKNNTLSCGLFGWSGNDPNDFNRDKFDKLGIYNEKRGTHSCGISIDGEILIGIKDTKVYRNFISTTYKVEANDFPVVIGHTRHATLGSHTIDNSHPFGFGINKEKSDRYEFIGAHNGTLLNHKELAKKFKIDTSKKCNKNKTSRDKIDSELLLEIIYDSKNFKVLNKYNGAAALLFTNTNEPNVLYCYHGKSKLWEDDKKPTEERPLFYYKESKNSLYVSSIYESLESIGGDESTIGSFEHNMVYKITDGDVESAEKIKISRKTNFQKGYAKTYSTNSRTKRTYTREDYALEKDWEEWERDIHGEQLKLPMVTNKNTKLINIHKENELIKNIVFGNKIYFNKLRYWRNGHTITGIFTWVPKFGFFHLGKSRERAEQTYKGLINKVFHKGMFVNNSNGIPVRERNVPFFSEIGFKSLDKPSLFYFFDGVRVKTELDYIACLKQQASSTPFSTEALSMCSAHPIIDLKGFNTEKVQKIILDSSLYSNIICPLGSDNIYTISGGNCVEITPVAKSNSSKVFTLKEIEEEILKAEEDKKEEMISSDLLDLDIEEMFLESYRDFPKFIKRLEEYPDNLKKAGKAIKILKRFIKETESLITLELNN